MFQRIEDPDITAAETSDHGLRDGLVLVLQTQMAKGAMRVIKRKEMMAIRLPAIVGADTIRVETIRVENQPIRRMIVPLTDQVMKCHLTTNKEKTKMGDHLLLGETDADLGTGKTC